MKSTVIFRLANSDITGDYELMMDGGIPNRFLSDPSDDMNLSEHLITGNLVLLPSDTCYSLCASAVLHDTFDTLNTVLDRAPEPISVACPDLETALAWVTDTAVTKALLRYFTPGPITVVAKANHQIAEEKKRQLIDQVIRSPDDTIGVRIPASVVETTLCQSLPIKLISTTAIRDPETGNEIRDFAKALEIVEKGLLKTKNKSLVAIEGQNFHFSHSTVVRVEPDQSVTLLREGSLPFSEILPIAIGARLSS